MTTYDGKCAGYNTGKKLVVNREPLYVNKRLYQKDIEGSYRFHRERVVSSIPVVDTKVTTYQFLEKASWKGYRDKLKEQRLMKSNELIYEHITQVETQEGPMSKEKKEHVIHIEKNYNTMNKFKTLARKRNVDKIQRENKFLSSRIKNIKPYYAVKQFNSFYAEHQVLKNDRRTDHTAGHLLTHTPAELSLTSLPPLRSTMTSLDRALQDANAKRSNSLRSGAVGKNGSRLSSRPSPSDCIDFLDVSPTYPLRAVGPLPKLLNSKSQSFLEREKDTKRTSISGVYNSTTGPSSSHGLHRKLEFDKNENERDKDGNSITNRSTNSSVNGENKHVSSSNGNAIARSYSNTSTSSLLYDDLEGPMEDKFILLVSRQCPLPLANRNCYIRAYCSREYDENIYIHVTSSDETKLLCERIVSIDDAYDMLVTSNSKSGSDDLQSLRTLLVNMFREADQANKGYLTYDEFQMLMERVDLGITPQELRFVIAEADENENGFIDYHEFVPLAVDMIQAFKARSKAKNISAQIETVIEDEVLQSVNQNELESICQICYAKFIEADVKEVKALRKIEIKKCMKDSLAGLTNSEINMILQALPRDASGRLIFKDFRHILHEVRYSTMRNTIIEAQGSEVQKYLMELCKEEEKLRMAANGEDGTTSGWIAQRALIDLMIASPRLSLTRLQVMVICSEATVVDGKVNYWKFIPTAAKAIEMMFDPKALRQRAELIEKEDMSTETLMKGVTTESISQRLMTLFKSYDIDHSGQLDPKQFRACLESLDLYLSAGEILTLMAIADKDNSGLVSFQEFCDFCANNLVHLEREKHIRELQAAVLDEKGELDGLEQITQNGSAKDLQEMLSRIFRAADTSNSGYLNLEQIRLVFDSLDIGLTAYQVSVVSSELDLDDDGMIAYNEFVPMCVDIILAFKGNKFAKMQKETREEWANKKAEDMMRSFTSEIQAVVDYIRDRIQLITSSIEDENGQKNAVIQILRDPYSGLNRNEANLLVSKLFPVIEDLPPKSGGETVRSLISSGRKDSVTAMKKQQSLRTVECQQSPHTNELMSIDEHIDEGENDADLLIVNNINNDFGPDSRQESFTFVEEIGEDEEEDESDEKRGSKIMMKEEESGTTSSLLESENETDTKSLESIRHSLLSHIPHLITYVTDVRKMTVMRGLLEELNPSELAVQLKTAFEEEALRLWTDLDDETAEIPNHLPYNSVYNILKQSTYLRLNQVQLLAIMSWAESYPEDGGSGIEFKTFASYAADVIVRMSDSKELEQRAELLSRVREMGEAKVMGSLTSEDLEEYISKKCIELQDSRGCIDDKVFLEILIGIPGSNLSEREAASVSAVAPKSPDGTVNWREFLPWSFNTLYEVCRERMIGRRIALLKVSSDPSDKSQLESLAQKLINIVRLKHVAGKITLSFPLDEIRERDAKRKGSLVTTLVQPRSAIEMYRQESSRGEPPEHSELARLCRLLPTIGTDKRERKVPMMIRIMEVDTMVFPDKAPLLIFVCSIDMKIKASMPIRTPSIGLVDREAAEQFAMNLIDKLYITLSNKSTPELQISLENHGNASF